MEEELSRLKTQLKIERQKISEYEKEVDQKEKDNLKTLDEIKRIKEKFKK